MDRIMPRSLAACRSFGRAMCAAVAGSHRRLPQPEVLPHSVRGIFSNYCDHDRPYFFARPRGTGPDIEGTFRYVPGPLYDCRDTILDHCNGLILYDKDGVIPSKLYVCNPATRRSAVLPPPHDDGTWYASAYLVFDPTISLDYKVFLVPEVPEKDGPRTRRIEPLDIMEWPPLHHKLQCFGGPEHRYAEYWRGALYVHCRGAYVMRLSLSEDKFQVIKTPTDVEENKHIAPFLGRSEKGVYYAALEGYELRIWILDEKREQSEWILKHQVNLKKLCHRMVTLCREEINKPWTLVDNNSDSDDAEQEVQNNQNFSEWDSDEDDVIEIKEKINSKCCGVMQFLGFHPYKEIVFLSEGFTVVAYHLGSSKAQYLGCARPKGYGGHCASFDESFVYTPCLIDSLPNYKL